MIVTTLLASTALAQSVPGGSPNSGRGQGAAPPTSAPSTSAAISPLNERTAPDPSVRTYSGATTFAGATIQDAGLGALVGPGGQSAGALNARVSAVSLDGKSQLAVDLYGDKLLSIAVAKETMQGGGGRPAGDGDQVQLSPRQASKMVDSAVNMNGVVPAQSITIAANGDVVLGGEPATDGKPNPGATPQTQRNTTLKSASTTMSIAIVAPVMQQPKLTPPPMPQPTVPSLLVSWSRSLRPLSPGDALASGAAVSSDGRLFAAYIVDPFNAAFPLAYALGASGPAIDYAVCYLANMWSAERCSSAGKL